MGHPKVDLRTMSPQERLDLLSEIWESLSAKPESLPLTDAQRQELDRRLDELESDSSPGIPWQEVLDRIRSRT
ncbi:MAG TPA: addiction module protein [Planctomycetota bacterium]|nr:addiction module protein [Planctomycetota bacterium]